MPVITATFARQHLVAVCRDVIWNQERTYLTDPMGQRYVTLDPRNNILFDPPMEVSLPYFRTHFSRCLGIIKDGFHLKITQKRSKDVLFARRHTNYREPLDQLFDQWRESVWKAAFAASAEHPDASQRRQTGEVTKSFRPVPIVENLKRIFPADD